MRTVESLLKLAIGGLVLVMATQWGGGWEWWRLAAVWLLWSMGGLAVWVWVLW